MVNVYVDPVGMVNNAKANVHPIDLDKIVRKNVIAILIIHLHAMLWMVDASVNYLGEVSSLVAKH